MWEVVYRTKRTKVCVLVKAQTKEEAIELARGSAYGTVENILSAVWSNHPVYQLWEVNGTR